MKIYFLFILKLIQLNIIFKYFPYGPYHYHQASAHSLAANHGYSQRNSYSNRINSGGGGKGYKSKNSVNTPTNSSTTPSNSGHSNNSTTGSPQDTQTSTNPSISTQSNPTTESNEKAAASELISKLSVIEKNNEETKYGLVLFIFI